MQILATAAAGAILWLSYVIYQLYLHPLAHIPGPKYAAVTDFFYCYWRCGGQITRRLQDLHETYGPVVRVAPNAVVFSSIKALATIYGNRPLFRKAGMYDGLTPNPGTGPHPIFPERDPEKHAEMRRIYDKFFYPDSLKMHEGTVLEYTAVMDKHLQKDGFTEKGTNITYWLHCLTSDVVARMIFGESLGSLETGKLHFMISTMAKTFPIAALLEALRIYHVKRFFAWMMPRDFYESQRQLYEFAAVCVQRHIENPEKTKPSGVTLLGNEENAAKLTPAVQSINHANIVAAGTETATYATTGSLFLLAKNPEVQQRLIDEIRDAFPSVEDITDEKASKLPYLRGVINEALRILPPASLGGPRISPGAIVDGQYIPEGTDIVTSHYYLQRVGEYFHDPLCFKPERWIDPDNTDSKRASQPFSLGSRNCIGRPLALMEHRMILAYLFRKYEMRLVDPDFDMEAHSESYEGVVIPPPLMVRLKPLD